MANNAPVVSWTGETNYVSDGLNPEVGTSATAFIYRVTYTDADNEAPGAGYPKVHIRKNGAAIAGSPFAMAYVSGNNNTGAIYSYSGTLSGGSTAYSYYFEAQDASGASASGLPGSSTDAPDVNNPPALSWTADPNYTTDGLDPEVGTATTTFVYRVKYTDADNDAPASGYPKVYILKGGAAITGSPFAMTCATGSYSAGVICSYPTTLEIGTDYTYYFAAYDVFSASASGSPASLAAGPTVYAPSTLTDTKTVNPGEEKTMAISPETGQITVLVPAGVFSEAVVVHVSTLSIPTANNASARTVNVGVEIRTDKGLQPSGEITITLYYRDIDVAGFNESKLVVCRYDSALMRWIPLPTECHPGQNYAVGRTSHLSKFALVQFTPAGDLQSVKVYPNPCSSAGVTFENLTSQAVIKIYTLNGEAVRTIEETDGDGSSAWDARNNSGDRVASGTYIYVIKNDNGSKKTGKISVIK
ncbi:MAG: hypothetical protein A2297_10375 [Elusimicrobia bacterium RIFOXYB2_FULL_48_7]|nr:MAG: hypothetical protein A2297_10375 [Elusimicrobia bacterium RIFOXYB2_FULL_48_7]